MSKIVFEEFFNKSEGKPFIYNGKEIKMSDKVSLPASKASLRVEFISTNSHWKQGIVLQTKGDFEINEQKLSNKIVLWEHTAPTQVDIVVKSKDKTLFIYNVWDTGDGTMHYGHNGGALFIEQVNKTTIYHCNDGYADDDFDDLIFKVEYQ
ncbi:MAG: hypothetical protein J0I84_22665 [Terrimonas sp.]|nr:hypothetical protein [Terrimonas sp.]OJY80980.1 MAG: hypothetical protein BGP13_03655 [Sphingobacteriales bacterium 40-81]